jgi:hypothetical protein
MAAHTSTPDAPQPKRRPGPPPGARPAAPTPAQQAVVDVQAAFPGAQHVETRPAPKAAPIKPLPTFAEISQRFAKAAAQAPDVDTLNEAWATVVDPHKDRFSEDERAALSDIHGVRFNEMDG